jgi:glycosyltransferase involved in cell wall biosynthesis
LFRNLHVGVLVPAFNEERLIGRTLAGMPPLVDRILVIDDGSRDQTAALAGQTGDPRVEVIRHDVNQGLGQALATGYLRGAALTDIDVWVVMASDNQMDPADLPAVLTPIADGRALYVKGNRLFYPGVRDVMPRHRFVGNAALTLLTKFATGYFHLVDPQCGYTAIHKDALPFLDLKNPHRGYGYNAHLLMQLNLYNVAVVDVPVRPVYGEAVSKIRLLSYIPRVSALLVRCTVKRITQKYLVRDFHPAGIAYAASAVAWPVALWSGLVLLVRRLSEINQPLGLEMLPTLLLFMLSSLGGTMLLLAAIWMDIEYSRSRRFPLA